jgi:hypothetical protein
MVVRRFSITLLLGLLVALAAGGTASASNPNGSSGQMPAYYDDSLFTINFKLEPNSDGLIAHNKSINTIYMCDQCEQAGVMFTSVLDAIQGDGFNPLWQESQVVFNPGRPPHQLTSDTAILNAVGTGEIHLDQTSEVYRCSVVGPN